MKKIKKKTIKVVAKIKLLKKIDKKIYKVESGKISLKSLSNDIEFDVDSLYGELLKIRTELGLPDEKWKRFLKKTTNSKI